MRIAAAAKTTASLIFLSLAVAAAGCTQGGDASAPEEASRTAARDDGPVARYCGGCHLPPSPDAHTAEDWPAVVARMQQHRTSRGLPPIPGEAMERIMDYLQQRARGSQ